MIEYVILLIMSLYDIFNNKNIPTILLFLFVSVYFNNFYIFLLYFLEGMSILDKLILSFLFLRFEPILLFLCCYITAYIYSKISNQKTVPFLPFIFIGIFIYDCLQNIIV